MDVEKDNVTPPEPPPNQGPGPVMVPNRMRPVDRLNQRPKAASRPRGVPTDEEPSSPGLSLFLYLSISSLRSSFLLPLQITTAIRISHKGLLQLPLHSSMVRILDLSHLISLFPYLPRSSSSPLSPFTPISNITFPISNHRLSTPILTPIQVKILLYRA